MKIKHLNKLFATASLVLACTSNNAIAAVDLGSNFTVDGTALGGGVVANLDRINFSYQATINQQLTGGVFLDGNDHFDESGFLSYSGFQNDGGVNQLGTGLNNSYKMYALFTGEGTGGISGSGILATFTSFTMQMFIDDIGDTTFNVPGTGIGATTTNLSGDDTLLGTANLLVTGEAHVFNGLANGDFQVDLTGFGLEVFGTSFFTVPNPFYNSLFLTGVTTSITGANGAAPFIAQATGSGDQAFSNVPEPTTLGLLGMGLLGFGYSSKRKSLK
jgi:hypothetical protein